MTVSVSSNAQKTIPGPVVSLPNRSYDQNALRLVSTQGQVQIHTATYRGSFPLVFSEALRSAGLGSRVVIAQFLKGGVNQGPHGAVSLCGKLEWLRPALETCLTKKSVLKKSCAKDLSQHKAVKDIWEICKLRLGQNNIDKIVLDEIGLAISMGFIKAEDLIASINNRPTSMDVILTGPSMPSEVTDMADQITKLRCS